MAEQAPDEAKEILSQLELQQLDYRKLLSLSPTQLWQVCKSAFSQTVRAPLLLLGTLTAVILLCAAMDALKVGFNAHGLDKVFSGVAVPVSYTHLWDIKGKAYGAPVYELLGGKHRDSLRAYASRCKIAGQVTAIRPGNLMIMPKRQKLLLIRDLMRLK